MKALVLQNLNQFPKLVDDFQISRENDSFKSIKLSAAAINHRDLWITKGMYPGIQLGTILGSDGVGYLNNKEVIINPGFKWGNNEAYQSEDFQVLGMPSNGTFSENIMIPESNIFVKPSHLSTFEAAALPLAGITAYRAIIVKAQLKKEDKVFISGIGGGVSLLAFQYAIAMGCEVYVSSSDPDKIRKAIELGAIAGVNYLEDDFAKQLLKISGGIDVVLDSAGGNGFSSLVYACNPGARMVFYGGTRGAINKLNPQIVFWRQIQILGTTMGSDLDFKNMLSFISKYKISPIIDRVYKLNEVYFAFDRMNDGKQFGKIVFDIKNS